MQFKIKNTDVKISFSLFAVFLLSIISGENKLYLLSFVSSLIHECVHLFFIKFFGSTVSEVSLSVFGGNIKRQNTKILSNYKEAIISFSAPFINIFIGVITLIFFDKTSLWGIVNLFIGLFNILPFYSFDGGRGLFYILTLKLSEKSTNTIITVLSVIITIAFSFTAVYIFFVKNNNYLLLIISIYMILSIIFNKR